MSTQALKEFKEGYHDNLMNKLDETYLKKVDERPIYLHRIEIEGGEWVEYLSFDGTPYAPDRQQSAHMAFKFLDYYDGSNNYPIVGMNEQLREWYYVKSPGALVNPDRIVAYVNVSPGWGLDNVTRL